MASRSVSFPSMVMIANRSLVGMGVAATGVGFNLLVILLNGGMPVMLGPALDSSAVRIAVTASGGFYTLADARTQLAVLGDVLPTPLGLASVGDVLLVVGVASLLIAGMTRARLQIG